MLEYLEKNASRGEDSCQRKFVEGCSPLEGRPVEQGEEECRRVLPPTLEEEAGR